MTEFLCLSFLFTCPQACPKVWCSSKMSDKPTVRGAFCLAVVSIFFLLVPVGNSLSLHVIPGTAMMPHPQHWGLRCGGGSHMTKLANQSIASCWPCDPPTLPLSPPLSCPSPRLALSVSPLSLSPELYSSHSNSVAAHCPWLSFPCVKAISSDSVSYE